MDSPIALRASRVTEPYGVSHDSHRPALVDFRGHNHVAVALPYEAIKSLAYHPTEGITVEFREHKVSIRGRNMRQMYDLLVSQKVTHVQEDDFDDVPETDTFIDAIIVERAQEAV